MTALLPSLQLLVVTAAILASVVECSKIFTAYFPNWAHIREPPYAFRPENMSVIVNRLDHLIYAYAHIDSSSSGIILTQPNDPEFIQHLVSYKYEHRNLKVLVSAGGDKFPSANFSAMVASYKSRAAFVYTYTTWTTSTGGIPCSKGNTIFVEEWDGHNTSCEALAYQEVQDYGGKCPDDATNLIYLVQQLRVSLPNGTSITLFDPKIKSLWKN